MQPLRDTLQLHEEVKCILTRYGDEENKEEYDNEDEDELEDYLYRG